MDKIEKIRQEIKRLRKEIKDDKDPLAPNQKAGYLFALADMESFLNSLSEESGVDVMNFCKPIDPGIAQCVADHWWEMLDGKEPSESLEEAAEEYNESMSWAWEAPNHPHKSAFIAGAEWMADHFEKERLRDCDELTPKDAQLEDAFVESHFKKNQRTPTFIDAIKYGAELQKSQMMKEAVEGYVNYYEDSGGILMAEAQVGCPYHIGDKVKIIIVKDE